MASIIVSRAWKLRFTSNSIFKTLATHVVSVAEQADLRLTCLETLKTGFLMTWLN